MESDGISIPKCANTGTAVKKVKQRIKVRIIPFFIITSIIAKKNHERLSIFLIPDTFVVLFAKFY